MIAVMMTHAIKMLAVTAMQKHHDEHESGNRLKHKLQCAEKRSNAIRTPYSHDFALRSGQSRTLHLICLALETCEAIGLYERATSFFVVRSITRSEVRFQSEAKKSPKSVRS